MFPAFVWGVVLVLLLLGEAATVGLTFIWFAVGAAGGLIAALLGWSVLVQCLIFLGLSALSLVLVRPLARRLLQTKISPTNADQVIGKTAFVTEAIDNTAGQGQVNISGQIWSARSEQGVVIPVDTQVRVLRIEGVKVFVETV